MKRSTILGTMAQGPLAFHEIKAKVVCVCHMTFYVLTLGRIGGNYGRFPVGPARGPQNF